MDQANNFSEPLLFMSSNNYITVTGCKYFPNSIFASKIGFYK